MIYQIKRFSRSEISFRDPDIRISKTKIIKELQKKVEKEIEKLEESEEEEKE